MRIHTTPDGIRYTIRHERADAVTGAVSPKGGCTVVTILGDDDTAVAIGSSVCHPDKDNFNYRRGHQIALGRALKYYRRMQAANATIDALAGT